MKQKNLVRWIESAEARAVCALATENIMPAKVAGSSKLHPTEATVDKSQLQKYLRQIRWWLAPFRRTRSRA
jgi:hypothetical protein